MVATTSPRDFRLDTDERLDEHFPGRTQFQESSVAWGAILAGGVAAVAATVVLTVLGAGLGLTTVSPWTNVGATAGTVGIMAIVWMIIIQWFSAGLGGYMAGRLRTRWTLIHSDEVFFRDTAHGFLSWALGTVVIALIVAGLTMTTARGVASGVGTIAGGAAQGASQAAATAGASSNANGSGGFDYYVDTMFRTDAAANGGNGQGNDADSRAQAGRILANDMLDGTITDEDRGYLAQLVAQRTGMSGEQAQNRVNTTIDKVNAAKDKAKAAADQARKVSATLAIMTALSLVIGAFIASISAALGGHLRDEP